MGWTVKLRAPKVTIKSNVRTPDLYTVHIEISPTVICSAVVRNFVSQNALAEHDAQACRRCVAVSRCMDSGSSNFKLDEHDPEAVLGRGLGRAKGVLIDAGLHSMYVHAIRRAKHFIYIENQFFTGMASPCSGKTLFCTTKNLLYYVQSSRLVPRRLHTVCWWSTSTSTLSTYAY